MKIASVEFLVSARKPADYPKARWPEVAFVGRSNVGKSSAINALVQRKGMAKTASEPGKTRGVNYFSVNGSFYLVDLPGYGFARVSKAEQEQWKRMVDDYLTEQGRRRMVVLLVDIRHPQTAADAMMKGWMDSIAVEYVVAATKADKLSGNGLARNASDLARAFAPARVIPFSSTTGMGRLPVLKTIYQFVIKED